MNKMDKINFNGRDFSKPSKDYVANAKLCPFLNGSCDPRCMFFRQFAKNAGFPCSFLELIPISFSLRDHFKTPRKYPNKR